jgi:hypothetical protein
MVYGLLIYSRMINSFLDVLQARAIDTPHMHIAGTQRIPIAVTSKVFGRDLRHNSAHADLSNFTNCV